MKKYNWPRNILKDAINDVFDIEKEQRFNLKKLEERS